MSPENFWWDIDSSFEWWNQSAEKAEKLNEIFKEKFRESQKALKKIKKEEWKSKWFDDVLAKIIEDF